MLKDNNIVVTPRVSPILLATQHKWPIRVYSKMYEQYVYGGQ